MIQSKKREYLLYALLLILSAAALLLLSSNTSILYEKCYLELNGSDAIRNMAASVFLVRDHLLPYRDLYTTGGPAIYLILALGQKFGGDAGILILQILAMAFCILLIFRTTEGEKPVIQALLTMLCVILCLGSYSTGASSVEFAMPFLLYGAYYAIDRNASLKKDGLMILSITVLIYINLFLGLSALLALLCSQREKKRKGTLVLLSLAVILLCLIPLFLSGMLASWVKMISEYYIPVLKNQLKADRLLLHRLVKMAPTCLILRAACLTGDRQRKIYYVLSWFLVFFYLISAEEAWFRYGILISYLPICSTDILRGSRSSRKNLSISLLCLLTLTVYIVPLKHVLQNYVSNVANGHYEEERDYILNWGTEDTSHEILCLDSSAKYYLLLDKCPSGRYYTRQSKIASLNEDIAAYLYDYLWDDECKGDLLIYHSSDGWCPESINHYHYTDICNLSEYLTKYEWSDEIPEDDHEHDDDNSTTLTEDEEL